MGCHTWFSVPYKTDKKEIIEFAQNFLDNDEHMTDGYKEMYQFAIDNGLEEPICELAEIPTRCSQSMNWILYKDVTDFSLENYNKLHSTNYDKYDDFFGDNDILESYSNEPRIGGYPDNIIRSYDEMVDFMTSGFVGVDGKKHEFRLDLDRKDRVMKGIKTFFTNHPLGIITFG